MMCGGPVCWKSKLQTTVALSSAESEYYALAMGSQEAMWIKMIVEEIGFGDFVSSPIKVFEDNQGCIKLAENPIVMGRAKHIETKMHFIRDLVLKGKIKLEYCPTEDMTADLLTKPLARVVFMKHVTSLMKLSSKGGVLGNSSGNLSCSIYSDRVPELHLSEDCTSRNATAHQEQYKKRYSQ
jgi:hypothetical protein